MEGVKKNKVTRMEIAIQEVRGSSAILLLRSIQGGSEAEIFFEYYKMNNKLKPEERRSYKFLNKLVQIRYDKWLNSKEGFNTILTYNKN
jgi:hypothetical protein